MSIARSPPSIRKGVLVQSLGVRLDNIGDARARQCERQRRSVLGGGELDNDGRERWRRAQRGHLRLEPLLMPGGRKALGEQ
eukprot:2612085-Prymnesium_polylepis.1